MPKAKNPKVDEAEALFREGLKLIDIAKKLGEPPGTVRRWKSTYKWDSERSGNKKANVRKKRGAPKGNKNASGPPGNRNAEKFGFFSKNLPKETLDIFNEIEELSPLNMLWHQIKIAYAAILRAQKLAYVKDQEDKTIEQVEVRTGKVEGLKWEVQQAWDKHNEFMKAQARAQTELRGLIKSYIELLHDNYELATEEQKTRIAKLQAEVAKLRGEDNTEYQDDGFIEALRNEAKDVWEE